MGKIIGLGMLFSFIGFFASYYIKDYETQDLALKVFAITFGLFYFGLLLFIPILDAFTR